MAYIKLLHLLSIFIWLGGLVSTTWLIGQLYKKESAFRKEMLLLSKRFHLFVGLPAMCLALATGVFLLVGKKVSMAQGWLHLKFTALFFLVCIDLLVIYLVRKPDYTLSRKGGIFFLFLHGAVLFFLMAVLVSIYILKIK